MSRFWADARQWYPELWDAERANRFPVDDEGSDERSQELALAADVRYMLAAWRIGEDEALVIEGEAPSSAYWIVRITGPSGPQARALDILPGPLLEVDGPATGPEGRAAMSQSFFDPDRYKWREVTGEPGLSYKVRHDYTILGYDVASGTLDMVVRWAGDGGHCPIHRHVATTTVLVLAGEQHLWDLHPDGTRGEHKVRRAGDYALTAGEALPHLERGGDTGGIAFFGAHCRDGILYEILDEDMKVLADVTIESLVADWQANT